MPARSRRRLTIFPNRNREACDPGTGSGRGIRRACATRVLPSGRAVAGRLQPRPTCGTATDHRPVRSTSRASPSSSPYRTRRSSSMMPSIGTSGHSTGCARPQTGPVGGAGVHGFREQGIDHAPATCVLHELRPSARRLPIRPGRPRVFSTRQLPGGTNWAVRPLQLSVGKSPQPGPLPRHRHFLSVAAVSDPGTRAA